MSHLPVDALVLPSVEYSVALELSLENGGL